VERTAIELAAAATTPGDPEKGLRAIADLRRRLDELEAWHVENAVRAGRSWSDVARALGVSKQAAHKRHAGGLRATARTALTTEAREHGLVVTAEARRVAHQAAREAHVLGHARVGTGHLLLGVLSERHVASAALESLGVTLALVQRAIKRPETPADGGPDRRLPISEQGRRALEQSLQEVVRRGDRHLGVEHVLLALVRDKASDAARTLARLGVTPREVEDALARTLSATGRNVRAGA
jgi:ATP-dependent Clp protease ATP-binding subunit ClpA